MQRRGFLTGMAGILAAGFAPSVAGSGILMPIRPLASNGRIFVTCDYVSGTILVHGGGHEGYEGIDFSKLRLDRPMSREQYRHFLRTGSGLVSLVWANER